MFPSVAENQCHLVFHKTSSIPTLLHGIQENQFESLPSDSNSGAQTKRICILSSAEMNITSYFIGLPQFSICQSFTCSQMDVFQLLKPSCRTLPNSAEPGRKWDRGCIYTPAALTLYVRKRGKREEREFARNSVAWLIPWCGSFRGLTH